MFYRRVIQNKLRVAFEQLLYLLFGRAARSTGWPTSCVGHLLNTESEEKKSKECEINVKKKQEIRLYARVMSGLLLFRCSGMLEEVGPNLFATNLTKYL